MQKTNTTAEQITVLRDVRFASRTGDTLVVRFISGEKVLVDYSNQDVLVLLQPHRRVYLQDLPAALRALFGGGRYAPATYIRDSGHRFTFDGSFRRSVVVDDLPCGQIVHVQPDADSVGVRIPLPPQPRVLYAHAAAAVAA